MTAETVGGGLKIGSWSAWPTADGCDYPLSDWALASDDGAVSASEADCGSAGTGPGECVCDAVADASDVTDEQAEIVASGELHGAAYQGHNPGMSACAGLPGSAPY